MLSPLPSTSFWAGSGAGGVHCQLQTRPGCATRQRCGAKGHAQAVENDTRGSERKWNLLRAPGGSSSQGPGDTDGRRGPEQRLKLPVSQQTDRRAAGGLPGALGNQLTLETGHGQAATAARTEASPSPAPVRGLGCCEPQPRKRGVEDTMSLTLELGGVDSQPPLSLRCCCCGHRLGNAARATQRTVGGVAAIMLSTLLAVFPQLSEVTLVSGTSSNLIGAFRMLRAKWPHGVLKGSP